MSSELIVKENFIPSQEIQNIVMENFGRKLKMMDLERWRVPTGGGTRFISTLDDDTKELIVLLMSASNGRVYYSRSFDDPEGSPIPDCVSFDAIRGIGDPGGCCEECRLNEFIDGKKPCSERYIIIFIRQGSVIPAYMHIPVMSVKPFRNKVLLSLTSKGKSYKKHVIKMTLSEATNQNSIKYSKINFEILGELEGYDPNSDRLEVVDLV